MPDKTPEEYLPILKKLMANGQRPIQSMTYLHDGNRFEVAIGKPRREYKRKKGRRGGRYLEDAGISKNGSDTGNVVFLIVDVGSLIEVYSYPRDVWAFPSLVSHDELERGSVKYFDL